MIPGLLRTMRPHQWVKNLFVLAPLIFAKELGTLGPALRTAAAFGLFCLASSTVYILNDLADIEADRAHPVKRNRPLASGQVPTGVARGVGLALAALVLTGSAFLGSWVFASIGGYLALNLAYTFGLKRVAYVDVLSITAGFELRVLAGTFAAHVPPTLYLLVVTFLLATFLGFGKRMHELVQGEGASKQRAVLARYDRRTLLTLLYTTGLATVGTYVVYTLDPSNRVAFGTDYLLLSAPMPLFGVLRFLHLVRRHPEVESPTEEMLKDKPFLANLALWVVVVLGLIYWA
ncbi:MAG: UbiA prenyltransferase family protein [Deltaproteobacteria bacterium]|nr:UbiA prenyltransferase family protein [Deltaproteobacteria bacterium]